MQVKLKLIFPDALEAMVKKSPDAIAAAIEKAVIKTLSQEVRVTDKIAFDGEDYDGNKIDTND